MKPFLWGVHHGHSDFVTGLPVINGWVWLLRVSVKGTQCDHSVILGKEGTGWDQEEPTWRSHISLGQGELVLSFGFACGSSVGGFFCLRK